LLGVSKREYVEAALEQPSLSTLSPETVGLKFRLYKDLITSLDENEIRRFLLSHSRLLTYAPEKIMAHYALNKLEGGIELKLYDLTQNPLTLAIKRLPPELYEIYKAIYEYYRELYKERKLKRKSGGLNAEIKFTEDCLRECLEYFGKAGIEVNMNRVIELYDKLKAQMKEQGK